MYIYKKGDRTLVENYRPISLLCIISKVFESIIYDKIISFVRPFISTQQFGFLGNRSCLSQLLVYFSQICHCADLHGNSDAVFVDFKEAFDSVPHQELLFKLWKIGITGPLWLWFRNNLSNRHHFVSFGGASSESLAVASGIPQGSVLGPLLFLVYINELPEVISHFSIYLFADDSKLVKSIRSMVDSTLLQKDINSLEQWCRTWNLSLNIKKCAALCFSLSRLPLSNQYYINGTAVDNSTSCKDLGIVTNTSLNWSSHYNYICCKAYRSLNLIKRIISSSAPVNIKKRLYISLVRSQLSYCSQLWRSQFVNDIMSLESVQRRSTKYIIQDYSSNYKQRLIFLNLLPLMYWYELQDMLF